MVQNTKKDLWLPTHAPIVDLEPGWLATELAFSFLEILSHLLSCFSRKASEVGRILFLIYFHIWGEGEINLKGVSSLI